MTTKGKTLHLVLPSDDITNTCTGALCLNLQLNKRQLSQLMSVFARILLKCFDDKWNIKVYE